MTMTVKINNNDKQKGNWFSSWGPTALVSAIILLLMAGSFAMSYTTMLQEAKRYGMTSRPELLPLVVDSAIVVFSILMIWGQVKNAPGVISYGWWGVVVSTFFTWFFNVGHAPWVMELSSGSAINYHILSIVYQTLYASVAPLMLAASLHGLTLMLESIVEHGRVIADLLNRLDTIGSKAKQAESGLKQAESDAEQLKHQLETAYDEINEVETQLNQQRTAAEVAGTERNRLEGALKQANRTIERLEGQVQQMEVSHSIVSMLDETIVQFFVRVLIEESVTQNSFAKEWNIPSSKLSRVKNVLIGDSRKEE